MLTRLVLIALLGLQLLLIDRPPALAAAATTQASLSVFRDPNCGCCEQWIEHMTTAGFTIKETVQTEQMTAVKQQLGVPQGLDSCHTAIANGYVLEGHVPAADVARLLAEQPDVAGLTVPGMPVGSPGMEMGDRQDAYSTLSFAQNGHLEVFADH